MGVQFLGLWFVAPEFQDYVKRRGFEEVELRLDPTDIGTISVKLSDNWIVASARDPKFHGMPLFEWLDTLKELERRYGHEARIAAPLVHAARQEIRRTDIDARMRAGHEGREEIQANIDRAAKHLPRGFQIFEDRDALQTADTDPLARRVKAAPKPSALRDQSPADKTAAFQLPSSNEDVHNKDDDVDDGGKVL
jgi:putative transposase